jgi:toxin ParE1/3/4
MGQVLHSRKAQEDLISIWFYIAGDNIEAADNLLDVIGDTCAILSDNPKLGQARPDIEIEMRYFPVKNYLILYRELISGIEVVRVISGYRDLNEISY